MLGLPMIFLLETDLVTGTTLIQALLTTNQDDVI